MTESRLSRRQVLGLGAKVGAGAVALGAAGYVGHVWPGQSAPAAKPEARGPGSAGALAQPGAGVNDTDVSVFVSRPDLRPPAVTISRLPGAFGPSSGAPRHIFVSPKGYMHNGPGQQGLMILSTEGHMVWFKPLPASATSPFDLQLQTYRGKPVLTWWEGEVLAGYGEGTCYLADSSYQTIATVKAGNGLHADLHELNLTPQGTALITTYRDTTADLSELGGSHRGKVLSCQAQEIDIATGRLLFSWDSLEHVPVTETRVPLEGKGLFDYFHMNSIALADDGDWLISARNTCAVYKVSRSSGAVIWRLNGKRSDFEMGAGSRFFYQHHVRAHPGGRISIFDDGASPAEEPQSRGIVLRLDEKAMRADLEVDYTHPARLLAANQGSFQLLEGGRVFIGWGDQPYFSEFAADGTMLLDGRFPADDESYRAFTYDWAGAPIEPPAIALDGDTTGDTTVYVSWNGATEVKSWHVLAGEAASSLREVASGLRTGFETVISANSKGPYFAVSARDESGTELGRSKPLRLS